MLLKFLKPQKMLIIRDVLYFLLFLKQIRRVRKAKPHAPTLID